MYFLMELSNVYNEKARWHYSKMMAPRLFAFIWISSFSVVLLAWRSVCASLRCGNRWLRNGQRKQIIRTHLLSETSSDYIGLVRETGLEPVRDYHTPLKRARLPIPPLSHILFCCFRNGDNYSKGSGFCQAVFAKYGAGFLCRLCGRLFEKQSTVIRHPPCHQSPKARSA